MAAENFLTYQETDPNSRIVVASSKVTWTALTKLEDAYVYKDKGAAYFDGNFVHLLTIKHGTFSGPAGTASNVSIPWAMSNTVGSRQDIVDASGDALMLIMRGNMTGTVYDLILHQIHGGSVNQTNNASVTGNTDLYLKIVRNESVGTYGTLYCYVYSDAARETLVQTFTLTLVTATVDFRYIYALQTLGAGTGWTHSGYTENLILEGGSASVLPEVTQQIPTSVGATTATGNGVITSIGLTSVTEHGHCWSTSANPTTADSKTTNGAGSLGAFTSAITGLTPGTRYYIRAYATNSFGTAYSTNVSFISGDSSSILVPGNLAWVGNYLVGIDANGNRRKILGDIY